MNEFATVLDAKPEGLSNRKSSKASHPDSMIAFLIIIIYFRIQRREIPANGDWSLAIQVVLY